MLQKKALFLHFLRGEKKSIYFVNPPSGREEKLVLGSKRVKRAIGDFKEGQTMAVLGF